VGPSSYVGHGAFECTNLEDPDASRASKASVVDNTHLKAVLLYS
jgi:hypothetical protein